MNKERRAAIDAVLKDLAALKEAVDKLPDAEGIAEAINVIAEEEREYHENMHDNLKGGEKGEAADAAATSLEEAHTEADDLGILELGEKLDEIVAKLEAARDGE